MDSLAILVMGFRRWGGVFGNGRQGFPLSLLGDGARADCPFIWRLQRRRRYALCLSQRPRCLGLLAMMEVGIEADEIAAPIAGGKIGPPTCRDV